MEQASRPGGPARVLRRLVLATSTGAGLMIVIGALCMPDCAAAIDDGSEAVAESVGADADLPDRRWGFGVSTGFELYRGDYGQRDLADSIRIPIGVSADWGPFGLGILLPIERAEVIDRESCVGAERRFRGPCSRFPRLAELIGGTTRTESSEEWGPGDLQLDLSATWIPESGSPWIPALTPFVGVKLPTGDVDDALGTGSTDATVGIDSSWLVGSGLLPFVTGGYTFVEDEEDFGLLDFAFASVGVSWSPGSRFGFTIAYDWRQRAAEGETEGHEIGSSLWLRVAERYQLEPFGLIGLSRSTPDFGAGLRVRVSL
ncbi:MAG: hypothetical protein ACX98W_01565 [bacterium]